MPREKTEKKNNNNNKNKQKQTKTNKQPNNQPTKNTNKTTSLKRDNCKSAGIKNICKSFFVKQFFLKISPGGYILKKFTPGEIIFKNTGHNNKKKKFADLTDCHAGLPALRWRQDAILFTIPTH